MRKVRRVDSFRQRVCRGGRLLEVGDWADARIEGWKVQGEGGAGEGSWPYHLAGIFHGSHRE